MNTYNIVLKLADGSQVQWGVSAKTWQAAIDAAKKKAGLNPGADTDGNLLICQWTGKLDVTA